MICRMKQSSRLERCHSSTRLSLISPRSRSQTKISFWIPPSITKIKPSGSELGKNAEDLSQTSGELGQNREAFAHANVFPSARRVPEVIPSARQENESHHDAQEEKRDVSKTSQPQKRHPAENTVVINRGINSKSSRKRKMSSIPPTRE